jgi:hypothetical protein
MEMEHEAVRPTWYGNPSETRGPRREIDRWRVLAIMGVVALLVAGTIIAEDAVIGPHRNSCDMRVPGSYEKGGQTHTTLVCQDITNDWERAGDRLWFLIPLALVGGGMAFRSGSGVVLTVVAGWVGVLAALAWLSLTHEAEGNVDEESPLASPLFLVPVAIVLSMIAATLAIVGVLAGLSLERVIAATRHRWKRVDVRRTTAQSRF